MSIELISNIGAFFDDDFINIIYKDLKSSGLTDEEVENKLKERTRDLPFMEENIFQLNEYKLGSIGFTSRELKSLKIDFIEEKLVTNDYNGEQPTNKIAYSKLLLDKGTKKILGFQIANERNVEKRMEAVRTVMQNGGELKELVKYKVHPTDNEWDPDLLNVISMMAAQEKSFDEVEASDIERLVKENQMLLDVREDYEFNAGHIKGAINMPLREIIANKDKLPKDKDIFVYCRSAHRSADAVNFMKSLGFEKVHNVKGGFIDISFNEFHKDKGELGDSILTGYNFD